MNKQTIKRRATDAILLIAIYATAAIITRYAVRAIITATLKGGE